MSRLIWPALFVLAAVVPFLQPSGYLLDVGVNIMLWAVLAYGLNVMLGYTGLLPLAHAGFFGIGAYTTGILTLKAGWSFWLAWPAGIALAALAGLLLGEPVAPAMVAVTGLVVLCVAGAKRFAKPPSSGLPTGAPVASPRR